MRTRAALATAVLGLALAGALVTTTAPSSDRRVPASDPLAALPLAFEPSDTGFVSRGPGYSVVLTPTETVMRLRPGRELRMRLVGANPRPALAGHRPLPGTVNYLVGDDPGAWRVGVPTYAEVGYADVYPGVDLVFHGNQRRLEHDFVVAPGADPATVEVEFPDARRLSVDGAGHLLVTGGGGPVRLDKPVLYQDVDGRRRPVAGGYASRGPNRIGFQVGRYDPALPLVIDPVVATSTYLGGSGNETAHGVDVDGAGNVYLTGSTESTDLATRGGVQARLNQDGTGGRPDVFVAKLNAAGNSLAYATYLGGSSRDVGLALTVGTDNSAYVTGVTESANFPTAGPAQAAFGGGSSDAFVARISPDGAALQYSTFLGGGQTDSGRGIAVDRSGGVYVTGSTGSPDFPAAGPFQAGPPRPDDVDAFVTKVNPTGSVFDYSMRLGGSNDDNGADVAVDATGSAFVTGDTRSPGFPTARPLQPGSGGSASGVGGSFADAFVSKVDPAGGALVYSTFLGGSDSDLGTGVAVDGQGSAFVTGTTSSMDFPTAGTPVQARKDGDSDAFVTKVNADGSALTYSSYLGGSGADSAAGVAVDRQGNAAVVGTASSTNFPTASATQGAKAGGQSDAFVARFDPAGSVLSYSTYLGGRDDDQGAGVALAPDGTAVVAGVTNSPDFQTVKALQAARSGASGDAFLLTLSEGQAPPAAAAQADDGLSGHQRRVRFLVGSTVALFLAAVVHTAYLNRRQGADPEWQGPTIPTPERRQTVSSGVRVLDDGDDEHLFGTDETGPAPVPVPKAGLPRRPGKSERHAKNRTPGAEPAGPQPEAAPAPVDHDDRMPVPDLLDETRAAEATGWWDDDPANDLFVATPPPAAPQQPEVPPAPPPPAIPRLPAEDLSFWDLFPEDLPVPSRPVTPPADPWATDFPAEDLLADRHPQPPAPPPPPPPLTQPPPAWEPSGSPVPDPDDDPFWSSAPRPEPEGWPVPEAAPPPAPEAADELLITEFLDADLDEPAPVPPPDPFELSQLLGEVGRAGVGAAAPAPASPAGGEDHEGGAEPGRDGGDGRAGAGNGDRPVRKRQRARRSGRRKRPEG